MATKSPFFNFEYTIDQLRGSNNLDLKNVLKIIEWIIYQNQSHEMSFQDLNIKHQYCNSFGALVQLS